MTEVIRTPAADSDDGAPWAWVVLLVLAFAGMLVFLFWNTTGPAVTASSTPKTGSSAPASASAAPASTTGGQVASTLPSATTARMPAEVDLGAPSSKPSSGARPVDVNLDAPSSAPTFKPSAKGR